MTPVAPVGADLPVGDLLTSSSASNVNIKGAEGDDTVVVPSVPVAAASGSLAQLAGDVYERPSDVLLASVRRCAANNDITSEVSSMFDRIVAYLLDNDCTCSARPAIPRVRDNNYVKRWLTANTIKIPIYNRLLVVYCVDSAFVLDEWKRTLSFQTLQ